MMNKDKAQRNLAILWFINGAIIALLMVGLSLEKLGNHTSDGWQWYSQLIVPTLTLMIGTFVVSNATAKANQVGKFYFRLAFWISAFYFLIIYIVIGTSSMVASDQDKSLIDILNGSKTYLTIIQGIVTLSLGMFFKKNR
jgi:hypothetical protein